MLEAPWWAAREAGRVCRASCFGILGVIIDLVCCASVYAQLSLSSVRCKSKNDVGGECGDFPCGAHHLGTATIPAPDRLTFIIVHPHSNACPIFILYHQLRKTRPSALIMSTLIVRITPAACLGSPKSGRRNKELCLGALGAS